MKRYKRIESGASKSIVDKWARIIRSGPILGRHGVKSTSFDPQRVGEGETFVGTGEDVAVKMVGVFQKDTMQKHLQLIQGKFALPCNRKWRKIL